MLETENRELTNVHLLAQLSYQKDRKKVSENIGIIIVNIPVLTLTANQVTSRSYSRISGIADPNDQVIAYLDDMVVGQIKIKKDGIEFLVDKVIHIQFHTVMKNYKN